LHSVKIIDYWSILYYPWECWRSYSLWLLYGYLRNKMLNLVPILDNPLLILLYLLSIEVDILFNAYSVTIFWFFNLIMVFNLFRWVKRIETRKSLKFNSAKRIMSPSCFFPLISDFMLKHYAFSCLPEAGRNENIFLIFIATGIKTTIKNQSFRLSSNVIVIINMI
jgi:hypothetical protein